MPLYVFALVDAPPARSPGRGLSAPLTLHPVAGAYALVERRMDVPPVELGAMRAHHAVVTRVARMVHAILPVRFGTLMDPSDLREALQDRDEEVADALHAVRDRVQFTWRLNLPRRRRPAEASTESRGLSGAEYLRRLARGSSSRVPVAFRSAREAVAVFVVKEKFEHGSATRPPALYQLVDRRQASAYQRAAESVTRSPDLVWSGPFPPIAFAPELL
jgi:Gas vesicle synthesis protein GvpL/GvpF